MSKAKFALGALVGAAAGLVAGFLTAPKSGKETREDLKRKANEIKDTTSEKVEKIRSQAEEKAGEMRDRAEEMRIRTENAVEGARKGFNKRVK